MVSFHFLLSRILSKLQQVLISVSVTGLEIIYLNFLLQMWSLFVISKSLGGEQRLLNDLTIFIFFNQILLLTNTYIL